MLSCSGFHVNSPFSEVSRYNGAIILEKSCTNWRKYEASPINCRSWVTVSGGGRAVKASTFLRLGLIWPDSTSNPKNSTFVLRKEHFLRFKEKPALVRTLVFVNLTLHRERRLKRHQHTQLHSRELDRLEHS